MKKIAEKFMMLFAVATLFSTTAFLSSCKDDEEPTDKNYFSVASKIYEIKASVQVNKGNVQGYYEGSSLHVYLCGDGVTIDSKTGKWSGKGPVLEFDFCIAKNDVRLQPKTYPYSNLEKPYMPGTLTSFTNDYSLDGGTSYVYITAGSAVVSVTDGVYQIEFQGKDQENNDVTVHYKGQLTFVDGRAEVM